ncbi:MAG: hypothetical protein LBO79_09335 [Zoogloeaceae bacterium]|nr:hypothetical protein [Zoogloeaceae bacterium]
MLRQFQPDAQWETSDRRSCLSLETNLNLEEGISFPLQIACQKRGLAPGIPWPNRQSGKFLFDPETDGKWNAGPRTRFAGLARDGSK